MQVSEAGYQVLDIDVGIPLTRANEHLIEVIGVTIGEVADKSEDIAYVTSGALVTQRVDVAQDGEMSEVRVLQKAEVMMKPKA